MLMSYFALPLIVLHSVLVHAWVLLGTTLIGSLAIAVSFFFQERQRCAQRGPGVG
jgi:hypothetical protein